MFGDARGAERLFRFLEGTKRTTYEIGEALLPTVDKENHPVYRIAMIHISLALSLHGRSLYCHPSP